MLESVDGFQLEASVVLQGVMWASRARGVAYRQLPGNFTNANKVLFSFPSRSRIVRVGIFVSGKEDRLVFLLKEGGLEVFLSHVDRCHSFSMMDR